MIIVKEYPEDGCGNEDKYGKEKHLGDFGE